VDEAIGLFLSQPDADSLRSVTAASQNPHKMWRIEGHYLEPLLKTDLAEAYNMPRQRLPATYWQTGHLDVIRRGTLLHGSMTGRRIVPYVVDPRYAVDIDTPEHWAFAEWMLGRGELALTRPAPRADGPVSAKPRPVAT